MSTLAKGCCRFFRFTFTLFALTCQFYAVPSLSAERTLLKDFYSEPGLSPFRDQVSANVAENIDPLSGNLHLSHIDLVVPGNGGMDIKIQRSYNADNVYVSHKTATNLAPNLTELLHRTPTGMGWSLHFGRVLKTGDSITSVCDDPGTTSLNSAILELPDGSRTTLFVNSTAFSARFITKDQWVASCTGTNGLLVISPDGTKYTMDYHRMLIEVDGTTHHAWYVTRIEDRDGNWISITYDTANTSAGMEPVFSGITTSDQRSVSFGYTDANTSTMRLTSITANRQTWSYGYTLVTDYVGGYYQLTSVLRPDGRDWKYSYHAKTNGAAGNRILNTVTHPYGGTVAYDYDYACFNATATTSCQTVYNIFFSLVVKSKVNGGRDVKPGTWSFSYSPSTTEDVTTVTFPGGKYVYRHYGTQSVLGASTIQTDRLWKMGLLKVKETWDTSTNTLLSSETYTWQPLYKISNEAYIRPPYDGIDATLYYDSAVWVPILTQKVITRDGNPYTTTYSNFDTSYNPQTISETGQASRTTNLTYFPRVVGQNIVRLVKDEQIAGYGKFGITRWFDTKGNLTDIKRYGVTEHYSYYASGDLYSKQDDRGITYRSTYSGYYRGIPETENHPEGITIARKVNASGTIASETNGRLLTTNYGYVPGTNLLSSIQRPLGSAVNISWSNTGRTVTRGTSYSQAVTFNGFGRPSNITTAGITQNIDYDALGRKSFESYLSLTPSPTTGTNYAYDALGRVLTDINTTDNKGKSYSYLAGSKVVVNSNERPFGTTTSYTYRSFGDPDNSKDRVLMRIDAPENVSTVFARNIIGQVDSVTQGGVTRSYTYFLTNPFLQSVAEPEIGTTTFGRDAVGNMTSRQVGGSGITGYTYDLLDRLVTIDYPGATPDVKLTYDENNNLKTLVNGNILGSFVGSSPTILSSRSYTYDNNDNLTLESLTVNGLTYSAGYTYTPLDYLNTITYPKGQVVQFNPDGLGRPSTVSPYITSAIGYHPTGQPSSYSYTNGRGTGVSINSRQWVDRIIANGGVEDLSYWYDDVANVTDIVDSRDTNFSRTLTYDGLDRLKTAKGVWGTGSLSYDATGNFLTQNIGGYNLGYSYSSNRVSSISGSASFTFGYDAYGNITSNSYRNFTYDDASNLHNVTAGTTPMASYDYDGKGMRVRSIRGAKETHVFYAKNGQLLGEYDTDGRYKEFVYLGSKLISMLGVSPSNTAPVANAGTAQSVNEGTAGVTLNGSASSDPGGAIVAYRWRQTSGPTVTLTSANTATPSFTAPRVVGNQVLTFTLTVDDGDYGTASATVSVTVLDIYPDDDADGLPDLWEMQYFGTLAYGPNDDPDLDGLTNLQEYREGTNPSSKQPTPTQVAGLKAQTGILSSVLSWNTVIGTAYYNVYWSTTPGVTKTTGTKISGVTSPSYAHPKLINGTRYYYIVTAVNNSGESPASAEVSAVASIAPLIPILDLLLSD